MIHYPHLSDIALNHTDSSVPHSSDSVGHNNVVRHLIYCPLIQCYNRLLPRGGCNESQCFNDIGCTIFLVLFPLLEEWRCAMDLKFGEENN